MGLFRNEEGNIRDFWRVLPFTAIPANIVQYAIKEKRESDLIDTQNQIINDQDDLITQYEFDSTAYNRNEYQEKAKQAQASASSGLYIIAFIALVVIGLILYVKK